MPAVIHLVRHGETTWHREGRVQGQHTGADEPVLTDLGREQARAAGVLVRSLVDDLPPPAVLSSDLERARASAHLVAAALDPEPRVRLDPAWREQHLGDMEGRLARELVAEPVPAGTDVTEVRWAGGESVRDVHDRVVSALRRLSRRGAGDHLVVVSHEHTIRVALAALRGHGWRGVDWDEAVPPGAVLSAPLT